MKKILLSVTVILTFIIYSLHSRFEGSEETNVVAPSIVISDTPQATILPASSSLPKNSNQASPPVVKRVSGAYKNGEYTGDVTDAYYGNLQVKAVITGGKITDVQFLEYPNDRRTSIEINTQAMPYLKQEAIQVQNANVDIISGATQTSRAFRQSLQSALVKAKI